MYVYMVCVYICEYVYVCVYKARADMNALRYTCVQMCACMCTYTCRYRYMYACVCVYVCVCVCVRARICAYICICIYVRMYMYTCMYICILIYMHTCMHTYTLTAGPRGSTETRRHGMLGWSLSTCPPNHQQTALSSRGSRRYVNGLFCNCPKGTPCSRGPCEMTSRIRVVRTRPIVGRYFDLLGDAGGWER